MHRPTKASHIDPKAVVLPSYLRNRTKLLFIWLTYNKPMKGIHTLGCGLISFLFVLENWNGRNSMNRLHQIRPQSPL